jgi:hypothetical protein
MGLNIMVSLARFRRRRSSFRAMALSLADNTAPTASSMCARWLPWLSASWRRSCPGYLAHLDRQPAIDGARHLGDDPAGFLLVVRHVLPGQLSVTTRRLSTGRASALA